jgi:hypothetical protein
MGERTWTKLDGIGDKIGFERSHQNYELYPHWHFSRDTSKYWNHFLITPECWAVRLIFDSTQTFEALTFIGCISQGN